MNSQQNRTQHERSDCFYPPPSRLRRDPGPVRMGNGHPMSVLLDYAWHGDAWQPIPVTATQADLTALRETVDQLAELVDEQQARIVLLERKVTWHL